MINKSKLNIIINYIKFKRICDQGDTIFLLTITLMI
jgi:hypothetical protein